MPTLSDARFAALRAKGLSGSTSDMLLQWLKALTAPVTVNLYVNPELVGGGVNTAPDAHTTSFLTNGMDVNEFLPGQFEVLTNTDNINGRSPLQYSVNDNNPGLEVGKSYAISAELVKTDDGNYGAAYVVLGDSNVTILRQSNNISGAGTIKRCFIEFRIEDPTWTMNVRAGCGTTANNSAVIQIRKPLLVELDPDAPLIKTVPDGWRAMLLAKTGMPAANYHRNDYWYALLGDLGYEGSMNDREMAFWLDGGNLSDVSPVDLTFGWLQTQSLRGTGWLSQRRTGSVTDALWINEAQTDRTPVGFQPSGDGVTFYMYAYDRSGTNLLVCTRKDNTESAGSSEWYYFSSVDLANPAQYVKWSLDQAAPFQQIDDSTGQVIRSEFFSPNEWVRYTAGAGDDLITFTFVENPDEFRDMLVGNNGDEFGYYRNTGTGALRVRVVEDQIVNRLSGLTTTDVVELRMEGNAQVDGVNAFVLNCEGLTVTVTWAGSAYTAIDTAFVAMLAANNGNVVLIDIDAA